MIKGISKKGLEILISEGEQFNFEKRFPREILDLISLESENEITILVADNKFDLARAPHHRCAVMVRTQNPDTVRIEVVDIAISTYEIIRPAKERA